MCKEAFLAVQKSRWSKYDPLLFLLSVVSPHPQSPFTASLFHLHLSAFICVHLRSSADHTSLSQSLNLVFSSHLTTSRCFCEKPIASRTSAPRMSALSNCALNRSAFCMRARWRLASRKSTLTRSASWSLALCRLAPLKLASVKSDFLTSAVRKVAFSKSTLTNMVSDKLAL